MKNLIIKSDALKLVNRCKTIINPSVLYAMILFTAFFESSLFAEVIVETPEQPYETETAAKNMSKNEAVKKIKLEWQSIEGMIKYQVQITDNTGNIIADKTVNTNYIEIGLPLGVYKMRIGAISIFEKLSFWSDWEAFEIAKSQNSKFFENKFAANAGITLKGGMAYRYPLGDSTSLYSPGYNCYTGTISINFGSYAFSKKKNYLKNSGLDFDFVYAKHDGQKNRFYTSNITQIFGGFGYFYRYNFSNPVAVAFRAGCGFSFSKMHYQRQNFQGIPIDQGIIITLDPYVKTGLSVDFNCFYLFNLQIGADFESLFFIDRIVYGLRFTCATGFRI